MPRRAAYVWISHLINKMYFWFNKQQSPSHEKVWFKFNFWRHLKLWGIELLNLVQSQPIIETFSFIQVNNLPKAIFFLFLDELKPCLLLLFREKACAGIGDEEIEAFLVQYRILLSSTASFSQQMILPARHSTIDNRPINNAIENLISLDSAQSMFTTLIQSAFWFNSLTHSIPDYSIQMFTYY